MEIPTKKTSLKRVCTLCKMDSSILRLHSATNQGKTVSTRCKRRVRHFYNLKQLLMKETLHSPDNSKPYMIKCNASDEAVSATLNHLKQPVAFLSQTLNCYETHYPAIEKEATAVIEAVRTWSHFLSGQKFVAFMMDNRMLYSELLISVIWMLWARNAYGCKTKNV